MDGTDARGQSFWPELQELARPARERSLPPERRSEVIVRLCARAALSVKDLSVLLDRSEAYVEDAIRPLLANGSLTAASDQPHQLPPKYESAANDAGATVDTGERVARVPNLWTNIAYVVVVAVILAISRAPVWLLFAGIAGAGLAGWHVVANSAQYRRFRELQPRRTRPTEFMLLKSTVTVIEIAIVYWVAAAGF